MAAHRKYKHTWEAVAVLHADHIKHWGAFDGYAGPVAFETGGVTGARLEHDTAADRVSVSYAIGGDVVRGAFSLYRQPSPLGGERVLFYAPCCGKCSVRLALLAEGIRCAKCGSITPLSRRLSRSLRAINRAAATAAELELDAWHLLPVRRPEGMNPRRFRALATKHAAYVEDAKRLLASKLQGLARDGLTGPRALTVASAM